MSMPWSKKSLRFIKKISNTPNTTPNASKAATFTPSLSQSMKAPPTTPAPSPNTPNTPNTNTAPPGEGIFKVKYEQEVSNAIRWFLIETDEKKNGIRSSIKFQV